MRLLLLRHGQTHGNTAGALDTAVPGLDLTELGQRQAEAAARALADRGIEEIFVSPLTRTRQTAAPLASLLGIEPFELDGLREISAGDFEMAADHDAIAGYIGTVADWIECRYDTRMPGGESGVEFLGRYDAAVAEIDRAVARAGHQNALAVSHGAAIRTWLSARVRDVEAHARATDPLHNTACIELVGDPRSGWTVEAWHSEPVGGAFLDDATAPDPTGQGTDEAAGHAPDQAQN
jgi:probable phosphoglycerate mutase